VVPLVLIAQPNRSGGTLLSQLLDGHPELYGNPGELQWSAWPDLDLDDRPGVWWGALRQRHFGRAFREGYSKDRPARKLGYTDQLQRLPFDCDPAEIRRRFVELCAERLPETQREVLDAYFTSLFAAWRDDRNADGHKRWVIGFRGRLRNEVDRFFDDYPDGRHVTCVREPKGRIASKLAYMRGRAGDAEIGKLELPTGARPDGWAVSTAGQLAAYEQYGPDRAFLLTFEQLITETEATMQALADWLGIEFDPILTEPTFNRYPIKANSSFVVERHGVLREPLESWRSVLTDDQSSEIDAQTRDLYARVCELASQHRPRP
jgi:hypothetical protein